MNWHYDPHIRNAYAYQFNFGIQHQINSTTTITGSYVSALTHRANIGGMYNHGQGVPQDYAEASKWYRLAAEQGYVYAQNSLGIMYAEGQGVEQDYVQAYMWFNLAATHVRASNTEGRALVIKNRDAVAAKMTPAQIAQAQRLADEWRPKAN